MQLVSTTKIADDNMGTILSEFQVGKYLVLKVDAIHKKIYAYYEIDGVQHPIISVYDIKNAIAIEAQGHFVGKTVRFVL